MLCVVSTAWGDEAVIYFGVSNGANSITVNGFTIAITGNTDKNWSGGNGDITLGKTSYKTLKNSNNAQNTITCPSGKVATQVVFHVTSNADSSGKLSEFDGASCDDEVTSIKDYNNPTIITKSIDNKNNFTFTFSTKQVCFIAVVTYTDAAADVVANPAISLSGNAVTMTCNTVGAKIYYTTDGTEPTISSTQYISAVALDNPCTIRAKAFNGENDEYSSDEVTYNCLFDHADAQAIIGWDTGIISNDNKLWTSSDGFFTFKNNNEDGELEQAVGFAHGLKVGHTTSYTIQPSADFKVHKVVVIGRTWLANGTASIAFDGFTPESSTFYATDADRNTYIKTLEFTPSAEQEFGQSIVMRPAGSQIGCYIEVYGVKREGPADPVGGANDPITWDFTDLTKGTFTDATSYSYIADDKNSEMRYTAGSSDAIVDKTDSKDGYLKENGKTNSATCTDIDGTTAIAKNRLIRLFVTGKGKLTINCTDNIGVYNVYDSNTDNTAAGSSTALISSYTANTTSDKITVTNGLWIETTTKGYINSIVWTPVSDDITLTTTDNMDGWRAFYDASNSYTVDENTKVYVATANSTTSVTLTELSAGIPIGTAVLLHTTSSADNHHKMTLTKAYVSAYEGTNLLSWTTSAVSDVYRLGYGDSGVGFYPYYGTPSSGAVILNTSSASSARALTISFSNDGVNGIETVETGKGLLDGEYYDLQGRRVAQPTKGLYILNGKKVVMK